MLSRNGVCFSDANPFRVRHRLSSVIYAALRIGSTHADFRNRLFRNFRVSGDGKHESERIQMMHVPFYLGNICWCFIASLYPARARARKIGSAAVKIDTHAGSTVYLLAPDK